MYFDEEVMLDLRLHTLGEHVDTFVIAEATRDHAGKEKKYCRSKADVVHVRIISSGERSNICW